MRQFLLLLLALVLLVKLSYAQSCNPASVEYLVRDEKGALLTREQLNSIFAQLPKQIGDATVNEGEVSFTTDNQTYYWPEDADFEKGGKVAALQFANAATCTMNLTEVTLTYQGKKMRLLFRINIDRTQDDRREVVDSIPFQEGTFTLDLTKWNRGRDKLIPASYWKKAK